jgi:hypothetical protein
MNLLLLFSGTKICVVQGGTRSGINENGKPCKGIRNIKQYNP